MAVNQGKKKLRWLVVSDVENQLAGIKETQTWFNRANQWSDQKYNEYYDLFVKGNGNYKTEIRNFPPEYADLYLIGPGGQKTDVTQAWADLKENAELVEQNYAIREELVLVLMKVTIYGPESLETKEPLSASGDRGCGCSEGSVSTPEELPVEEPLSASGNRGCGSCGDAYGPSIPYSAQDNRYYPENPANNDNEAINQEYDNSQYQGAREEVKVMSQEELNQALLQAASQGDLKEVTRLLDEGADPNYEQLDAEERDETALINASRNGRADVVKLLIERGAQVNKPTPDGEFPSALFDAVDKGNLDIINLLLNAGANLHFHDYDILHTAIATRNTDVVRLLLDRGADVHYHDNAALIDPSPISRGDTEMVRLLLEYGADPNARNGEPLEAAIHFNRPEIQRLLLESGAIPQEEAAVQDHFI